MKTSTLPASPVAKVDQSSPSPTESFFEDPLRIHTILVASDLSEESYRAFEFAVPLAEHFGATVHAVHVYEGAQQLSSPSTGPALRADREIRWRLGDEVQRRGGRRPGVKECHIRAGKAFQEIISAARELKADLIVVATHGYGGFQHLRLGSTTEKIVRHAPCPVLVVRQSTRGPIRTANQRIVLEKILVPIDFSECAKEGAKYGAVFASKVGADLQLLHVVNPPDYIAAEGSMVGPAWPQLIQNEVLKAEDELDEVANFLPLVGISAETCVEVGPPAEKIIEASAQPDVDLIITSTHGYSGLRHALLGSVTEEVARRAKCPVLVVPSHRRSL